jgi:hypothetical protein
MYSIETTLATRWSEPFLSPIHPQVIGSMTASADRRKAQRGRVRVDVGQDQPSQRVRVAGFGQTDAPSMTVVATLYARPGKCRRGKSLPRRIYHFGGDSHLDGLCRRETDGTGTVSSTGSFRPVRPMQRSPWSAIRPLLRRDLTSGRNCNTICARSETAPAAPAKVVGTPRRQRLQDPVTHPPLRSRWVFFVWTAARTGRKGG